MADSLICDELCEFDFDVESTDEFFEKFVAKAQELNYVKDTYLEALKTREANYPTALPTEPFSVAIPHSDPEHIIKQFIAPIRLKHEIEWHEIANNDSILKVQIVFVLGFKKEDGHVKVLQVLLEGFQDEERMKRLIEAKTKEEFLAEVHGIDGLNNIED